MHMKLESNRGWEEETGWSWKMLMEEEKPNLLAAILLGLDCEKGHAKSLKELCNLSYAF